MNETFSVLLDQRNTFRAQVEAYERAGGSFVDPDHRSRPHLLKQEDRSGLTVRSSFPEVLRVIVYAAREEFEKLVKARLSVLIEARFTQLNTTMPALEYRDQLTHFGKAVSLGLIEMLDFMAEKDIRLLLGFQLALDAEGDSGLDELLHVTLTQAAVYPEDVRIKPLNHTRFQMKFGEKGVRDVKKDSISYCPFFVFSQVTRNEILRAFSRIGIAQTSAYFKNIDVSIFLQKIAESIIQDIQKHLTKTFETYSVLSEEQDGAE